jgi:maltose alpha-D-glucosyltransferase/alpha-amylase
MQAFVFNQGDAWTYTLDYLTRELEEVRLVGAAGGEELSLEDRHGFYFAQARTLGQRTGEMHRAFAIETDLPDFRPEPITEQDLAYWRQSIGAQADRAFAAIERARPNLPDAVAGDADAILARRDECLTRIDQLCSRPVHAMKTRLHGDYHLGQVLVSQRDFYIIDFEGEPARSMEERRAKTSPAKDVAGMLRSFDYATWAAVLKLSETGELPEGTTQHVFRWRERVCQAFLDGYVEAVSGSVGWPESSGEGLRLVDLFAIEKALYEIAYEAANRPAWLGIPIKGLMAIVDAGGQPGAGAGHGG